MNFLKLFLLITLVIFISFEDCNANLSNCNIVVKKPNTSYEGRCSWFKINKKAAINHKAQNYVAMRWDYDSLSKHWGIEKSKVKNKLKNCWVLVKNPNNGKAIWCRPGDYGPARWTGRSIDCDPKILKNLDCQTDDILVASLHEKK